MVNGLYTSGAGMMLSVRKQELTANNLANAQTTGFKVSRLVTDVEVEDRRDHDQYMRQIEKQTADEVHVDWSDGPLITTGNPLDVALRGTGFMVVSTPAGDKYLRSASLQINANRELVDLTGAPVLGEDDQPIVLPTQGAKITKDGKVISGDVEVARLKLVDFGKPYTLREEGAGRWAPFAISAKDPVPTPQAIPENTHLEIGALEGSNSNTVALMVQMISNYRNYEADSRLIQSIDGTLDKAVNSVGRVG